MDLFEGINLKQTTTNVNLTEIDPIMQENDQKSTNNQLETIYYV